MNGASCAPIGSVAVTAASGMRGWRTHHVEAPDRVSLGWFLWQVICCPVGHAWRESCLAFLSGVRIGVV